MDRIPERPHRSATTPVHGSNPRGGASEAPANPGVRRFRSRVIPGLRPGEEPMVYIEDTPGPSRYMPVGHLQARPRHHDRREKHGAARALP